MDMYWGLDNFRIEEGVRERRKVGKEDLFSFLAYPSPWISAQNRLSLAFRTPVTQATRSVCRGEQVCLAIDQLSKFKQ